jgi:hypothetical protein
MVIHRRWVRLLGLLLLIPCLGLAALYFLRLQLARYLLAKSLPGLQADVSAVDWQDGALVLQDVQMGIRSDGAPPLLTVKSVRTPWSQSRSVGRVVIDKPSLHLDAVGLRMLEQLIKQNTPPTAAATSPTPFSLAGLEIRQADLHYTEPNGKSIQATLDWRGEEIVQQPDGSLAVGRQVLTLQPKSGGLLGTASKLPPLEAEWSIDPTQRKLVVHRLANARPGEILVEPELMALLSSPSASAPSKSPSPTRSPIESVEIVDAALEGLRIHLPKAAELDRPLAATLRLSAQKAATGASSGVFELSDIAYGSAQLPSLSGKLEPNLPAKASWGLRELQLAPTDLTTLEATLQSFGWKGTLPFTVQGRASLQLPQLLADDTGIHTPEPVTIELADVQAQLPGAPEPFASWKKLTLVGQPEQPFSLHQLHWEEPKLRWSQDVAAALAKLQTGDSNNEPQPNIVCQDLRIKDGEIALQDWGPDFPDIRAKLAASTAPLVNGGAPVYQFTLQQPVVAPPGAPPLYQGQEVFVALHPERVWTRKSIELVRFENSRVDVGATAADAQMLVMPETTSTAPAIQHGSSILQTGQEPGEEDAVELPSGWHIRSLVLNRTRVHLHHLIPDLAEIVLPVAYQQFQNVPLTPEELAKQEAPLRLELPMVHLPGTRAGTSMADLDTNFFHFSLAGLMRKEIDRVQLVNPKIYVGDSLFHYVSKLRAESAKAPAGAVAPAEPTKPGGWTIHKLQASNGKLITTVKDSPLLRVPPLPFGAESSLKDSEIQAELAIPPGLYKPILGMELVAALQGGSIKFNLPKKELTNNLVQVFRADWLRYKQLRFTNVRLSVTYDEFGIYAQFWAEGYGGLLSGAFNLYLTDNLSWDGWISLSNVSATELSKVLTPNYFQMSGSISGELIAQGDKTSLYQATGKLQGTAPGSLKILALEDVIKAIPDDWQAAQRAWTIKALETVRDFRYETFTSDLRFYGVEGKIHLNLTGPDGQRNFEVNSHDRRVRVGP